MKHFQKILEFQKLLKKFNQVQRDLASLPYGDKMHDNDVEHSYRAAMLCWMIIDEYKLKLDTNRVIKYALIHDLVEVYAGDMSMYKNYKQKDKEKRERKSFEKLKKDFPKQKTLWKLISDYEQRKDKESKFVYMIEKLEPVLAVLLSEKDHWKKRRLTMESFLERMQRKIKSIDTYAQIFNKEIVNYLKKNKKLFYNL
jgi:5'-deoxynucleotidase YfbR-like HD superfamily hydrolase